MKTNSEAEACANLGYVMAQNGETAKAKEMYLRALTLDNKMQVAAKAVLQIEEREQTRVKLASASTISPSSIPFRRELPKRLEETCCGKTIPLPMR